MLKYSSTPLVSVMVVTYNHEKYVAQALDSILAQNVNFSIEIVIADDCSIDQTPTILTDYLQKHPEVIRLLSNDTNLGVSRNFERAMKASHGKYVAIIEGDDYWTSMHKLQKQVDFMEANPEFTMCFHNAEVVYENDPARQAHLMNQNEKPEYSLNDITSGWFIATASVMYRNGVLPTLPSWVHKSVVVDLPLFALLATKGRIGYLSDLMSVYRVHSNGVTRSGKQEQFLLRLGKMCQYLDEELQQKYHRNLTLKQSDNYNILAGIMAGNKQYKKARNYFVKSLYCKFSVGEFPNMSEIKNLILLSLPVLRRVK
ncbi:glycosyltransferase [Hymenobacter sp. BT730]|uniref:glycosyltransferase n=1 Tax=Hymenobacter sp. BT730 TaxID=3063332 RepID=UPI0026DEF13D|nr:glycosyltransferase [Hymenobacter sp. BT730]